MVDHGSGNDYVQRKILSLFSYKYDFVLALKLFLTWLIKSNLKMESSNCFKCSQFNQVVLFELYFEKK